MRHVGSFFVCVIWTMQNLWNVARYMGDARAQLLPLVGNGDRIHDWSEILGRWGALESDIYLANRLSLLAGAVALVAWGWFLKTWLDSKRD